jgi:hypothetical protein
MVKVTKLSKTIEPEVKMYQPNMAAKKNTTMPIAGNAGV